VLLPYGLEIRLGIKKASAENTDAFLDTARIGRKTPGAQTVFSRQHSYNGSYTELRVDRRGVQLGLETARTVTAASPVYRTTPAATGGSTRSRHRRLAPRRRQTHRAPSPPRSGPASGHPDDRHKPLQVSLSRALRDI